MKYIYCDHSASTPLDPQVLDLMNDIEKNTFGNPSSIHRFGQSAKALIENSRRQVASSMLCSSSEIYFTSGGSESNNMVIKNILNPGDHIISTSIEHPAILEPIKTLESNGIESTLIKPESNGIIKVEKNRKSNQKQYQACFYYVCK